MTVCIAGIFRWPYSTQTGTVEMGTAVLVFTDRMITAGDVQYEPAQLKVAYAARNMLIVIAGDYTMHSEAIKSVHDSTRGRKEFKPHDIALMYGTALQAIQRRQAEDVILAPLGLNTDTFLAQQKDMSPAIVDSLTLQMQNHAGAAVEALVVGMENNVAHLYEIDQRGTIRCYDDVGFGAIGAGGWHARSSLMQAGYVNTVDFSTALTALWAAKKTAEVAPGVGKATDIHIVFRDTVEILHGAWEQKVREEYDLLVATTSHAKLESIIRLREFINDPKTSPNLKTGTVSTGDSDTPGQSASSGADDPADGSDKSEV